MADIALQYPPCEVFADFSRPRSFIAGVGGITQGQAFYIDPTTGTALPTNAAQAGKYALRGVATSAAGAGYAFDGLEHGFLGGFDVSALAFDALVYVSDTAGKLGTTAGTNSSVAGRVVPSSDKDPVTGKPSKLLFIRPSVI